jgi:hypothetical protein
MARAARAQFPHWIHEVENKAASIERETPQDTWAN